MSHHKKLTQERLRHLLHYDQESGLFTRKVSRCKNKVGTKAGTICVIGYVQIRVDGNFYYGHRLAFLYMTGNWPENEVDHINMIRHDNRWMNLRHATRSENNFNTNARSRNKLGIKGVCFSDRYQKFIAQISVNGHKYHIGKYETLEEATMAYTGLARLIHGEFYREVA